MASRFADDRRWAVHYVTSIARDGRGGAGERASAKCDADIFAHRDVAIHEGPFLRTSSYDIFRWQ